MAPRKKKVAPRSDGVVEVGPPGEIHALPANKRARPTNGPGATQQFPPIPRAERIRKREK